MIAVAIVLCLASQTARAHPDFSGTWVVDAARTAGADGLPAAPVVITQTPDVLTIEQQSETRTRRIAFRLDGTESRNLVIPFTVTTRSRWEAGRLVSEGTQTLIEGAAPASSSAFREVRWLEPDGTMIVETTRVSMPGTDAATRRVVYTRKAD